MSLEFQDGAGNTFCCEGADAPSNPNDPNIDWSTACNGGAPRAGGCTIASVGFPDVNVNVAGNTVFHALYGNKYPNFHHHRNRHSKTNNCGCR